MLFEATESVVPGYSSKQETNMCPGRRKAEHMVRGAASLGKAPFISGAT